MWQTREIHKPKPVSESDQRLLAAEVPPHPPTPTRAAPRPPLPRAEAPARRRGAARRGEKRSGSRARWALPRRVHSAWPPPGPAGTELPCPPLGPWHGRRAPAAAPAPWRTAGELNLPTPPYGASAAALLGLRRAHPPAEPPRSPPGTADGEARGRAGLGVQVGLLAAVPGPCGGCLAAAPWECGVPASQPRPTVAACPLPPGLSGGGGGGGIVYVCVSHLKIPLSELACESTVCWLGEGGSWEQEPWLSAPCREFGVVGLFGFFFCFCSPLK